ncbi:asparagine synthase [Clostridiaceae bacterium 35-E11]
MEVREGLIPTALGSAVTLTGAMMKRRDMAPMIAAGIVGFGLAHIVLGTVDMVQHNRR